MIFYYHLEGLVKKAASNCPSTIPLHFRLATTIIMQPVLWAKVASARGSNRDLILKEMWWYIFTSLPDEQHKGLLVFHSTWNVPRGEVVSLAFKGTSIGCSNLEQETTVRTSNGRESLWWKMLARERVAELQLLKSFYVILGNQEVHMHAQG